MKPHDDESREDFLARCVPMMLDDGEAEDNEQAVAMCSGMYEGKAMSELLTRIKTRNAIRPPSAEFGYGITTADRYVQRALSECGDGLFKATFGCDPQIALKESATKLVYANPEMILEKQATSLASMEKLLKELSSDSFSPELPKHAALVELHVITTPRIDRDKDILRSEGATVDPRMPDLYSHMAHLPIGKMIGGRPYHQSEKGIKTLSVLLDLNELTADLIKLVEADVLRWSHGFRALEWSERKRGDGEYGEPGFDIKTWEMMEESRVAVPSNIEAEMELYSRGKLASDYFKAQAKHYMDNRQVKVPGCSCGKTTVLDRKESAGGVFLETTDPKPEGKYATEGGVEYELKNGKPEFIEATNKHRYAATKHFSVENEYLEAHKLEYEWVSRFIGCEVKELKVLETGCRPVMTGSFLSGCRAVAQNWHLHDTRNITSDGKEKPPIHKVVQLNSRMSDTFLTIGMQFWKADDGNKIVVKFCENWNGGIECRVYSKNDKGDEFIGKAWTWARENNYLKGEAFALTGDFLPKTTEAFDDVFLEEKNKEPLKKLTARINEKGKALPNRGIILQGPPGTGKTLSARIIRNQAKSTFIWVSARDFYQVGAISGICSALDLARDLAPSIVCLEDVDNWLTDYCVDVLKSELDGVARSSGVVTILTTNYPERMPDTLIDRPGRFHDILEFGLPSKHVRQAMLSKWLVDDVTDEKFQASNKAIDEAAEKTEGYSGAHLYELCSYAKTIAEEDELSLDEAVEKAIDKIKEQRELINQSQLAGSNYRPSRREAQELVKGLPAGVKHVLSISESDGQVSITFEKETEPSDETEEASGKYTQDQLNKWSELFRKWNGEYCLDIIEQAAVFLAPFDKRNDLVFVHDIFDDQRLEEKAGRTLSKKNLEMLQEVMSDMEDLKGMDGMGRPHKALCERCIRNLAAVIESASSGEEEEKPKDVEITPKQAAASLLANGDDALLKRVGELIDVHFAVQQSNEAAKEYRALTKST